MRKRRIWVASAACACGAIAWPALNLLTCHPDETVILLMPPVLGAMLWWGWPVVRRTPVWKCLAYAVFLTLVLTAAEGLAAYMARGRLLLGEVFWALYFTVAWRMAWAVWGRTVGRWGERHRRWSRRARRAAGGLRRLPDARRRRWATLAAGIRPLRIALAAFVFAPLMFGSLIHRIKIGNSSDFAGYDSFPIEAVTFRTADGLNISGWFLREQRSDSAVVICHGLGANKGNFADFLSVFYGRGYSALIFDFRGHGESDGHTSTFGLFETADVRAAVDWLKTERPAASRHVFGLGSSMGAMALVREAADDPRIEAVVLDSAYTSAPRLAQQHLGRVPVVGAVFAELVLASLSLHAGQSMWALDASDAIARISPRPVLLIHGTGDFIIPPANLDLLYDLARQPKSRWLGPGPHSNIMTADFDGYQARVIEFFGQAKGH